MAACTEPEPTGNTLCYYPQTDGCIYQYFCNPPNKSWVMTLEPVDCPGLCANPYPDAICLEPGKVCYYDNDEGCVTYTCTDGYVFDDKYDPDNPCP